ncbi:NADH:flavin oxidoreductase/NADH oxidase [Microbaculum marinisediminis]|uniref:NADH:flavin oxidoreductase/NADH oxidase n=1 Tax=Microbaculum marinisediminis TaxID=2931392 RepID=A0AAW5QQW6_9HYPH|nr:NADH:flavin oxidoreductase/NADH oxidase [Microbaculum sp. A6E488]MCT8970365.1 NADH:flavin oxidoreductase/NADH oxidase [Microbaculum sp. A6E488]
MTSQLFSPFELGSLRLENRIVVSPMCQYSAVDGSATDWHLIHLGNMALSGAALLIIEATAVEPQGRITPGCLGLYSDDNEAALRRVLEAVRGQSDMPIGIQIGHAGRKASSEPPWRGGQLIPADQGGWPPVAPSAVPMYPQEPAPLALDVAGIERIRDAFVASARRAAALGLDALELHCAHGYLLHEFLSPLSNHRDDRYGGSLDNRMRLPLEIFEAVRAVWPADRPLGVRISATDWVEGGWDLEQSVAFVHALKARGCDWIDGSSAGVSPQQKITLGPGYQVPFARQIRAETGITTLAVGLITEPQQAEAIIADGDADLIGLGRGLLWEPRWPWHAAATLGGQVRTAKQYWRSLERRATGVFKNMEFGMR